MANYMKPKRRSFVAGIISFVGSLVFVYALYLILSAVYTIVTTDEGAAGKIVLGVLVILLCAVIQYSAVLYDKYREHRKWKKRLENAGIEEELSSNYDLCWQAYRSNPTPMGLKYIEERNPKAAEDIKAYLTENATGLFGKSKSSKAETVKVNTKDQSEEKKVVIETQQDWENGETIIK